MTSKQIIETILLAYSESVSNDDIRKTLNKDLNDEKIMLIINQLNNEYKINKKVYILILLIMDIK